jgi:hypothetical protein
MLSVSCRLLQRVALGISIAALLPLRSLGAQEALVVTARMSSRPLTQLGADSGKFMVSVRISGIPEFGLRTLGAGQIVLVDGLGRRYTPIGYTVSADRIQPKGLLAAFTPPPAERSDDRQYLFVVSPGLMTFELRVAGLKPVRMVPTITPSR